MSAEEPIICPVCKKEDKKSVCREDLQHPVPLVYHPIDTFYDEDGKHHSHMPTGKKHFKCSNGHGFLVNWVYLCWCGWPKKK